ncbi:hypothetical protein MNBD_GAMMA01-1606 [hydrothermal vent metagenome]|uniref:Uncharacterized protein n=1 Tax=hydrothermal vent metagenome TaxID=652676 RepID=A0A3B0VEM3_9ZZZZ
MLNYRYKSNIFKSSGSYSTAYILNDDGSLKSQRSLNVDNIRIDKKGQPILNNTLTLNYLRLLIKKVKSSHEK